MYNTGKKTGPCKKSCNPPMFPRQTWTSCSSSLREYIHTYWYNNNNSSVGYFNFFGPKKVASLGVCCEGWVWCCLWLALEKKPWFEARRAMICIQICVCTKRRYASLQRNTVMYQKRRNDDDLMNGKSVPGYFIIIAAVADYQVISFFVWPAVSKQHGKQPVPAWLYRMILRFGYMRVNAGSVTVHPILVPVMIT